MSGEAPWDGGTHHEIFQFFEVAKDGLDKSVGMEKVQVVHGHPGTVERAARTKYPCPKNGITREFLPGIHVVHECSAQY
jgi:hypothetical protein